MIPLKYLSLLPLLLLLSSFHLNAPHTEYINVVARPGESPESLMSWYELGKKDCNLAHFYHINQLSSESLVANKVYKLPIYFYKYNGKSIRSTLGISDLEKAKRIQKYNERMYQLGLQILDYRVSKMLWVPHHEIKCEEASIIDLPKESIELLELEEDVTTYGSRRFPIFGKAYEHIPLKSKKLQGKVFYVIGGHGGPDPGAVGWHSKRQLCEDEYAYDIALRLAWNLLSHGATTYLITRDANDGIRSGKYLDCDKDERSWGNLKIPASQKPRLQQRTDAVNGLYNKHKKQGVTDQRLISLHVDSRSRGERIDVFFYHHPNSDKGKVLAKNVQKTFKEKYDTHQRGRGYEGTVVERDLFVLRETYPAAVYVELANIRNPKDQARILLENNRQALANWLYEGLIKD